MTPHRPCVVGFGELVWDVLPHATLPGGAPANFAWHAQQCGVDSTIVSAVGDDAAGHKLLAWLDAMELNRDHVQTGARATGRVDVVVSDQGEPSYFIQENTAWDEIRWNEALAHLAGRADCVCFGSLAQRSRQTRETLRRFLSSTGPDCLRVFDVNLRQPLPELDIIEQSIPLTDVLKLNEDEWPLLGERLGLHKHWERGCHSLLHNSPIRLIALTRGARGSVLVTRDEKLEMPADAVDMQDTIGAGDSFCAALAVGVLQHRPLREVQRAAAMIAAFVCTQPGATPRLPDALTTLLNSPTATIHHPTSRRRSSGAAFVAPLRQRAFDGERAESH